MAEVFVFGSNQAGRHGAGSALEARKNHGAIYGQGEGRQGNSYGIPTKDWNLKTLPLGAIAGGVHAFLQHARLNTDDTFKVVAIGTGLAGYSIRQIAPFFWDSPQNVILPEEFANYLATMEQGR